MTVVQMMWAVTTSMKKSCAWKRCHQAEKRIEHNDSTEVQCEQPLVQSLVPPFISTLDDTYWNGMLFNRCESTNVNEPQLYWAFSVSTSTRLVPLSKSEVFTELCCNHVWQKRRRASGAFPHSMQSATNNWCATFGVPSPVHRVLCLCSSSSPQWSL